MENIKQEEEYDFIFKIVIVGDSGVGKTNLLSRYISNTFSNDTKPTIGVELSNKTIFVKGKRIKVNIWDTAGQERYKAISGIYYKGTEGALIVYDITKSGSFKNVAKWYRELIENCPDGIIILLIGNKSDLKQIRAVKQIDASDFAKKHHIGYIETSSLESYNIDESFQLVISSIFDKNIISFNKNSKDAFSSLNKGINLEEAPKGSCCCK